MYVATTQQLADKQRVREKERNLQQGIQLSSIKHEYSTLHTNNRTN